MAQKVTGFIKLQIPAGKATPAPPVGPALGQHGVNIMAFTKEFNERTKNDVGLIIPVVITVYADRSFTFITKTPPAAILIKKACGIQSGSGVPNKTKVAKITREQVKKIQFPVHGVTSVFPLSTGVTDDPSVRAGPPAGTQSLQCSAIMINRPASGFIPSGQMVQGG